MTACPSCRFEFEGTYKFCPECGTPLGVAGSTRALGEERKVVTSLFCDLVGFTAMSEAADPEDVARMSAHYFRMVRARIEAHGGVVEKFVGDAVVGVFGVPAAHEDDPERAVRAALRIVEDASELETVTGDPLRLRIGVNTGEALVMLGISPASGEGFVTGDSINTASRLQSVAPEMGVVVGVATYEATSVVFDYEELPPATMKGKAEPVRVFHAKATRASLGADLARTGNMPFVGREIDLALLKGIFAKAVASDSVQLVTVTGEPGLGKTRLVAEFGSYIDERPELVVWRQGRCLPYGEGITFWALTEIVKGHAGILESDSVDVVEAKLELVLPPGAERAWFRQRLLPLVGLEASSSAERDELFTAWRRFLEHIAEEHPTVLVFEDLHWADEAMLAFLEHLADRAERMPLMLIGTARPELFERRPDYSAGLRNAIPISLSRLSDNETARLMSAMFESTVLPVAVQQPILDRAEGNPLYVGEFVRLLKDKDLLVRKGASWDLRPGAEVPFPSSVQALIAARLDTLGPAAKSMLADAAVVGKVFWAGAVAAMGGREPAEVEETLRELSRKELIRPSRRPSISDEAEYSFLHILTRDVAYAQLPRASRSARHVAAASWIESKSPDRVDDLADVLAYHYSTALELARAGGQADEALALEAPALRFLSLAGERALEMDAAAALTSFERCLALTPVGHPGRAASLARFGDAALQSGRVAQAKEALEEAIATFHALGDVRAATRAMATLGVVFNSNGDPRGWDLPAQAIALLEPLPPGPELVAALGFMARADALLGREDAAIEHIDRAEALAVELGLERSPRLLGYRGLAHWSMGDRSGIDEMREAIVLSTAAGQGRDAANLYNNLGVSLWGCDGPEPAIEALRTGVEFAEARGLAEIVNVINVSMLDPMFDTGALDELVATCAVLAENLDPVDAAVDLAATRSCQARILAVRGDAHHMSAWLDSLESTAGGLNDAQCVVLILGSSALARAAIGQLERAAALIVELAGIPGAAVQQYYSTLLPAMVRTALAVGDISLAERLVRVDQRFVYTRHACVAAAAAIAEAHGDLGAAADGYVDAAARWEAFGVVPERAFALLGRGRCLAGLARHEEATSVLRQAREIFHRLGAAPSLSEIDSLLQHTIARTS